MAMSCSLAALGTPLRINDPQTVAKTFPDYFARFAEVGQTVPVIAIDGTSASGKGTIAARVAPLGVQTRLVRAKDLGDTKLIVENDASQVKIEVNVVFRGSVLPVERRPLSAKTSDLFGVEFELPVLAPDELYASKLVAALDRQHPRDLFDVWQLFESGDISDGMVECFVIYLAGHNRPPHEVLFGNDKDIGSKSIYNMTIDVIETVWGLLVADIAFHALIL
jgi:hypothetical protein